MSQAIKLIGLKYEDVVYYAMVINLRIFDSPAARTMTERLFLQICRKLCGRASLMCWYISLYATGGRIYNPV
ncbi:MAG: hypothetical protein H6Q73_4474 [Firmicutes bacterium]|nr:hypothetical protein [Bacillota bacterium]